MNVVLRWPFVPVYIIVFWLACVAEPCVETAHRPNLFSMVMVIQPDGTMSLRSEIEQPLLLNSYYIIAPTSLVDVEAWDSLAEQFAASPETIRSIFGEHVGNVPILSGVADLGDGQALILEEMGFLWPGGLSWPLGKPLGDDLAAIRQAVDAGDVMWTGGYCELCQLEYPIVFEIPQPATIILLVCGVPVLCLRARVRRRRHLAASMAPLLTRVSRQ